MAKSEEKAVLAALRKFAEAGTAKITSLTACEPEKQLRGPFEAFTQDVGNAISRPIVCTGEVLLADRLSKPDYAIRAVGLLGGGETFHFPPDRLLGESYAANVLIDRT